MLRKLFLPLLMLALLGAVGCSDNPTETATEGSVDLNEEFGGYTATAEEPGFGDTDLLGEAEGEVDYDDPMLLSPTVDSFVTDPEAGYFRFRAIWGQLTYDSTVTEVTDWTGSLTISRGAEVVKKLIRFEPGQDELLPRTERTLIEWVSATTVHHDGIVVDMYFRRPVPMYDTMMVPEVDTLGDTSWVTVIDTTYPQEATTVTFETGPYSRTFTLGDLVALDTIVYLEDSNAVAIRALKLDRVPCARGFLTGHWGVDEEGNGLFRGMWMSRHGYVSGWLQGRYGVNERGRNVFAGKWINASGEFEGLLKGTYGFRPNDNASGNARRHAGGWFVGTIHNADGAQLGALKGHFKGADHPIKAGYFQGLWRLDCGDSFGNAWDTDYDNDGFRDDDGDEG